MKNTKKMRKLYAAWDYELELAELDFQSTQGWQLQEGKLFSRVYEKDDSKVYRHQLDYNGTSDTAYYEMFAEQGWEYVNSTINGWNYFRKEVKGEFEESDYCIYTDVDSKEGMNKRFLRVMVLVFLAGILANMQHLFHFIATPKIANSPVLFVYMIYGFFFLKALLGLRRSAKGQKPKYRTKIELYFILLMLVVIFMVNGFSSVFGTQYRLNESYKGSEQNFIYEVDFSDFYYMSLEPSVGVPIELTIENNEGEEIYKNISFGLDGKRVSIFLPSGTYRCIIDGDMDTNYTFKIK